MFEFASMTFEQNLKSWTYLFADDLIQLLSARDMAQRTVIRQDQIVYSTEKDFVEQDYEAQEWDRKFRELEKSD